MQSPGQEERGRGQDGAGEVGGRQGPDRAGLVHIPIVGSFTTGGTHQGSVAEVS